MPLGLGLGLMGKVAQVITDFAINTWGWFTTQPITWEDLETTTWEDLEP